MNMSVLMSVSIKCGLVGFLIKVGSRRCVINHLLLFYRYMTGVSHFLSYGRNIVYKETRPSFCNIYNFVLWL